MLYNSALVFYSFLTCFFAARYPNKIREIILFSMILTAGAMFNGYPLWDEVTLLGILLVGLLVLVKNGGLLKKPFISTSHEFVFFLFLSYLIFESVRGMFVLGDPRMVRFILYFSMVAIIPFVIRHLARKITSSNQILGPIIWAGLIYFTLYMIHGLYFDFKTGSLLGRYLHQGELWSGSAYAFFPILCTLPAAVISMRAKNPTYKILSPALIFLTFICSIYYDSRLGSGSVLLFASLIFIGKGLLKRLIILSMVFGILGLTIANKYEKEVDMAFYMVENLSDSLDAIAGKRNTDLDRFIFFKAGFHRLTSNPTTFFIGDGYYVNRYSAKKSLKALGMAHLNNGILDGPMQVTGTTAFLIDMGLIGVILLLLNVGHAMFQGVKLAQSLPDKFIILIMGGCLGIWAIITNIQDLVIYLLLIMPNGIMPLIGKVSELMAKESINNRNNTNSNTSQKEIFPK